MGQILSSPVREKFSENGEDAKFYYGVSSMQGWRVTMEDAHATVLDVLADGAGLGRATAEPARGPENAVAFFGVYDGHGGDKTAIFAGDNTHKLVAATDAFKRGDYGKALQDGFLATDAVLIDKGADSTDTSGCAATAVLINNDIVVCGNSGDSRTVLSACGSAKSLSFDHKPDNEGERARIMAAGGFVDVGRVNGNLALSRALGDFTFKKSPSLPPEEQVVTAFPDIIEHRLKPTDEFIVLACDGIWDCMHSQEVVEFVRRGIADKLPLPEICELLMEECLAPQSDVSGIGCDNMTVCIVALLQGQTKQQWYDAIADRVARGEGPVASRSMAEIRDAIESRPTPTAVSAEDAQSGTSPQVMLQQLFAGGDGSGRLHPEATSLLSRLGIRFLGADEDDEGGHDDSDIHDEGSVSRLPEDSTSSVEHEEDNHEPVQTPRDEWN